MELELDTSTKGQVIVQFGIGSVTSAVRLHTCQLRQKTTVLRINLSTPNTIYMPKAALVRFTFRTLLITVSLTNSFILGDS